MTAADFATVQRAVLRRTLKGIDIGLSSGNSLPEYVERLLDQARTSTIPVLILTDAIEGKVPVEERLDFLADFAQAQFDHYLELKVLDPKLGPYEALGRALSGSAGFHEQSYQKADHELIVNAWIRARSGSEAEGPSDAVVEHYLAQLDYFVKLYQGVALSKSEAGSWARGAVYGQIFGAAASDDDNRLFGLARQFLRDAAAGTQRYGLPLQGVPRSLAA